VFSSQDKFRAQQTDLTALETRRQDLLAERDTYKSVLDALQDPKSNGSSTERLSALAASPVVSGNAIVSQLFTQLVSLQSKRDSLSAGRWGNAATNPDVQRLDALIGATAGKVVSAAKANLSVLDVRIATLDRQKTDAAAAMATLPQAEATEAALLAQVTTYSRQVDRLRDELQSAEIDEAAQVGQIEILDMAQASGVPIGAGRRPRLILAILLGLALGSIVAYVLENYRPVIRRRDELEESLALPNLALVPQLRTSETHGKRLLQAARFLPARLRPSNGNGHSKQGAPRMELVTLSDARSSGAEAYRTLRTNLLFSAVVRAVSRIVVTSPGPEEGKSTTAANLAIAFAQQGRQVLLIDCDLRRARIHKIFEVANLPGLTTVLAGGLPVAEAIRPTRIEGLMILPSGPLPPNPAELLGSTQMNVLLDRLSQSYDILILDTPPLLAASDAAIVSRMSDGALVVVRAGRTERSALQTAVQQLITVGARVLGTVLNDPDAEVPKYARYYGYHYNNYYDYPQAGNSTAPTVQ
jgi:tyrosine-protein kinase Etk/Wzc